MTAIVDFLDRVIGWIAAFAMAVCFGLFLFSAIALNTLPKLQPDWLYEVTIFLLVWAVLLGVARIEKRGGHIRVEFLIDMFGPKAKAWSEGFSILTAVAVAVTFIWSGIIVIQEAMLWDERTDSSLRMPYWWMYASLAGSFSVHLLFILDRLRRLVTGQLDLNAGHSFE